MMKQGTLFLIIGNSGSGKDTIIREVIKLWPDSKMPVRVAKRYVTRPPHESENHVSITPDIFYHMKREGKFFLTWHSYDLEYGIGKEVLTWISQGTNVLINVSRLVVSEVCRKIPGTKVIFIFVPLEVTIARLKKRKREPANSDAFHKRLLRAQNNPNNVDADFTVENIGSLKKSAQKLRNYMLSVIG